MANEERLNRDLIIGWAIIVGILFVAYLGEVLKGERSLTYALVFMVVTGAPALFCWLLYQKNHLNYNLRYIIVAGYFVMYLFVMVSGSTMVVFTYMLPLLSLLILYHQPSLIAATGGVTFLINVVQIVIRALNHEITMYNSKDVEIQIAVLVVCFGGSFVAAKLYDDIYKKNEEYVRLLDEKSQQIQRMTLQTIETIANTIDAKDEYTKGHSKRVADYSYQLAKRLGLSEEEVMNIRYIALLHDIGKIGVPDSVLNKPGKLTDAEYELMKKHTVIGGEILKDIKMLPDLNIGARFHHERYDGGGYPNGLKGEEIPLIARIICLADAYDAMTSNRVYRKHLNRDVVLKEIKRCKGTQFDPELTEAFLEYLEEEDVWLEEEVADNPQTLGDESNRLLQKIVYDQNKQMIEEAERDELTGVYNRSAAERKIIASMREHYGCLFLVNLDGMRAINRKYGFRRGDHYLTVVAKLLQEFSENSIISRFGGDEFMCYIPDLLDMETVQKKMEDFLQKARKCREEDELLLDLSISAGITFYEQEEVELQQLLMEADKAMYHVKQEGKSGYYFYRQVKDKEDVVSKADLRNLIQAVRWKDNYSEETLLANQEFFRVYDFILDLVKGTAESVQLILLTAKPIGAKEMGVEAREGVMRIVEHAVMNILRDENAMTKYSSIQRIVLLVGEETERVNEIAETILNEFYRMYGKNDIELHFDTTQVGKLSE